jgi:hypothetical protein
MGPSNWWGKRGSWPCQYGAPGAQRSSVTSLSSVVKSPIWSLHQPITKRRKVPD